MIGPLAVSGAVLLFPVTYIFVGVFTEVYGSAASRRATVVGQAVDRTLVISLTFAGKYQAATLLNLIVTGYGVEDGI